MPAWMGDETHEKCPQIAPVPCPEGGVPSDVQEAHMGTHMGTEEIDVVIIGAGQAGLAVSHELAGAGISHAILERDAVGGSWHRRWDSFCLVTPNHTIRLPGAAYD